MTTVKQIFIATCLLGLAANAQLVRQIDLGDVGRNSRLVPPVSDKYTICGSEEAKNAAKGVSVSVESITPDEIRPREHISVVLKVENRGKLPVVLPLSPQATSLNANSASWRYAAMLPVGAGTPGGVIEMGWFQLFGSTKNANTTVVLRPGRWIVVRGKIQIVRWYTAGQTAEASSALQLYEWSPSTVERSKNDCVRQVPGGSIPIRFAPPN